MKRWQRWSWLPALVLGGLLAAACSEEPAHTTVPAGAVTSTTPTGAPPTLP